MWIICNDFSINSDHIESISEKGTSVVAYAANDPYESTITLASYENPSMAHQKYSSLIGALGAGESSFKMN